MKKIIPYDHIDYKITDLQINEVLFDETAACFSALTCDNNFKINENCLISLYLRECCVPYSLEEIETYILLLNMYGFPCYLKPMFKLKRSFKPGRYNVETNWNSNTSSFFTEYNTYGYINCYQIDIVLKECYNKVHYLSILYLLRVLQEDSHNFIPKQILSILKEFKDIDFIQAVYLVQLKTPVTHHYVFNRPDLDQIYTYTELFERIKAEGTSLDTYTSVINVWQPYKYNQIPINHPFELIKTNSYYEIINYFKSNKCQNTKLQCTEL